MSHLERQPIGPEPIKPSEIEHNCIFCGIVEGRVPASVISETTRTTSFMSLEGHPLIVPKTHVEDMADPKLDMETAAELGIQMVQMVRAVQETYGVADCNVFATNGKNAGQEVMHAHIHIIPREPGDKKIIARRQPFENREVLNARASLLRARLQQQP